MAGSGCSLRAMTQEMPDKSFEPIPHSVKRLSRKVVEAASSVHKHLGPGLLERVYEACFCYELSNRGICFLRQVDVPIVYDNLVFDEGLRLDVLVENSIICELKADDEANPVWEAQVLSHLKLSGRRLGFLINFNVRRFRDGVRRFVV